MTAITFNTAHQAEHARERLQIVVASFRELKWTPYVGPRIVGVKV